MWVKVPYREKANIIRSKSVHQHSSIVIGLRCYVAPTSWIFRFVWIIAARLVDNRQRKRVLLLSSNWCGVAGVVGDVRYYDVPFFPVAMLTSR